MTTTTTAFVRACFPARSTRSDRTTRLPDPASCRDESSVCLATPISGAQPEKVSAGLFPKRGRS